MSIVISGVNNNDKITASDGTIDLLSGVTYNSEITVPSLKLGSNIQLGNAGIITATTFSGNISGNITGTTGTFGDFVNVGSNIQLGNAGVVTATTFVGNVTGNVNNTGALLFQIGGGEKVRITSAGKVGINSTSPTYALEVDGGTQNTVIVARSSDAKAAISFLDNTTGGYGRATIGAEGTEVYITSGTAGSESLRIDSGGRLLLGHTSSQDVYASSKLQIQGTTAATSSLSLLRHGNSPYLTLGSSGGSSLGAVNALSSGNRIGQITFAGADGTDINTHAASISAYVDGSVSSNNVPAHIRFATGPSETERVRIQNGGLRMNGGSYIMEVTGGSGAPNNASRQMDQRRWMWYGASSSTHTVARVAKAAGGQPGDGDSQLAAFIVTYTARSMYGFNSDGGYSVMKMRTGRFDYNDNEVRFSTEQDTLGTGGGSQNPTIVFTDEGSGVVRISITNPSSTHSFGEINVMTYDCRITLPTG